MATDARIRYTKMIIQVNFVSLLKKKPINKITVKEICELAEMFFATPKCRKLQSKNVGCCNCKMQKVAELCDTVI